MTHQPAISISISFQNPFNRAGGRTSDVRKKNMESKGALKWLSRLDKPRTIESLISEIYGEAAFLGCLFENEVADLLNFYELKRSFKEFKTEDISLSGLIKEVSKRGLLEETELDVLKDAKNARNELIHRLLKKMKTIAALLLIGSLSALGADPSLKPQLDPTEKAKYAERQRFLVDLDGDGVDDMLLSGSPDEFGTMGGPWTVYLKRGEDYKSVGEIWAHPMAIAFEPAQTRFHTDPKTHRFARVWVYLKSSGSAGSFGYYCVGKDSVDEMASLEIYPGDGGTSVGNAIYEATFKKSPIPYRMQTSKTGEDGTVKWPEIKR